MYEDLEYEFNGVSDVNKAMSAFGFGNFLGSGNFELPDPQFTIEGITGTAGNLMLANTGACISKGNSMAANKVTNCS